jgi:protein-disulfide isomerase
MEISDVTKTILSLIAVLTVTSAFTPAKAEGLTDDQKKEINTLIEAYIKENPKVMLDSVMKYQEDMAKAEEEKMNEGVKNFVPSLKDYPHLPFTGNAKGDVTVVEFFDYNCGYCKRGYETVQKLLDEDKNVKMVFVDLPILGPQSHEVSKWALAAVKQNKYFEYHRELMKFTGNKDDKTLEKLAKNAGIDVAKLKKDKDDPSIEEQITKNQELAKTVSVQGTPAFVVNDQIVRGYLEIDAMKDMIKGVRNPGEKKEDDKKSAE